jgi:hypothetical protein
MSHFRRLSNIKKKVARPHIRSLPVNILPLNEVYNVLLIRYVIADPLHVRSRMILVITSLTELLFHQRNLPL